VVERQLKAFGEELLRHQPDGIVIAAWGERGIDIVILIEDLKSTELLTFTDATSKEGAALVAWP
jgi:hypothetical protein